MNNLPKNLFSFVRHFLRPYKGVTTIYIFMAICAGAWGPINGMLIKYMINTLSLPQSESENISLVFWPAVALILNFVLFDNATWRILGYLNYRYQPAIKNKIILDVFQYVLGASQAFFQDNLSGRISNQITSLADNVVRILYPIVASFIRSLSLLIIALISMYFVNPKFFYTMALWSIVFFLLSYFMSNRLVNLSDKHADSETKISGKLVDSITNVYNIRIFSRQAYEISQLDNSLLTTKKKFQKKELFLVNLHSIQGGLIAIMLGFMVYFLIYLYKQHEVSLGDFALILGLTMEVAYVTWFTMSQIDEFHQALGKCKQSLSNLIVPQDIVNNENANNLHVKKGQIAFTNVQFNYNGMEDLFQNKSIVLHGGQKVGLVGYSGSGKSTFVNLILRLYNVSQGQIFIDEYDISKVTQDSLRERIAMIPQDPALFHRTLMENIRYGRIDASDEEVIAAAKKAHAHEFICKLPMGYHTPVGERGVKLSGGQRQRIAIARAILKAAPILILDEATSQLDSVTENDIQQSLWELMHGKTAIVIAHRLSTLLHMDRILVFNQGKIVEDGTHHELLANRGLYKTLWEAQMGGFLPETKI